MHKQLHKELRHLQHIAEVNQECKRMSVGCTIGYFDQWGVWQSLVSGVNGSRTSIGCTNEVGNCGCSHAEPRAIVSLLKSVEVPYQPLVMLCTHAPCATCANLIIDCAKIICVVYNEDYRITTGRDLLEAVLNIYKLSEIGDGDLDQFRRKI